MIKLFSRFFKKQKYTIVAIPFVFAFLAHAGLVALPTHTLIVKSDTTPFMVYGEESTISLNLEAETPINVIGGVITYPHDQIEVTHVAIDNTLVNLWARKPSFSNELGIINFGGGIVAKGGFIGGGNIFTIYYKTIATGTADVLLEGAVILAQDGKGTNVLSNERNETIYIRDTHLPSPDVTNDGVLSLSDINTVYLGTFGDYNSEYDINGDGEVSLSDVSALISLL